MAQRPCDGIVLAWESTDEQIVVWNGRGLYLGDVLVRMTLRTKASYIDLGSMLLLGRWLPLVAPNDLIGDLAMLGIVQTNSKTSNASKKLCNLYFFLWFLFHGRLNLVLGHNSMLSIIDQAQKIPSKWLL